jgi:hypothetical protein
MAILVAISSTNQASAQAKPTTPLGEYPNKGKEENTKKVIAMSNDPVAEIQDWFTKNWGTALTLGVSFTTLAVTLIKPLFLGHISV